MIFNVKEGVKLDPGAVQDQLRSATARVQPSRPEPLTQLLRGRFGQPTGLRRLLGSERGPVRRPVASWPDRSLRTRLDAALHRHLEHQFGPAAHAARRAPSRRARARRPLPAGDQVPGRLFPCRPSRRAAIATSRSTARRAITASPSSRGGRSRPSSGGGSAARTTAATCRRGSPPAARVILLHNFYVPAGGDEPDPDINPKFGHKLDFLDEMQRCAAPNRRRDRLDPGRRPQHRAARDTTSGRTSSCSSVVSHTPVETEGLEAMRTGGGWVDLMRHFVPPTRSSTPGGAIARRDWARRTAAAGSTISGRRPISPSGSPASRSCAMRAAGSGRRTTCR